MYFKLCHVNNSFFSVKLSQIRKKNTLWKTSKLLWKTQQPYDKTKQTNKKTKNTAK